MKTYLANRLRFGTRVAWFDTDTHKSGYLDTRQDLAIHPQSFDWGGLNAGSQLLAVALLADYLGDDRRAITLHLAFQRASIASLAFEEWELTGDQIDAALKLIAADRGEEIELLNDERPTEKVQAYDAGLLPQAIAAGFSHSDIGEGSNAASPEI